jgi:hypothetical protein
VAADQWRLRLEPTPRAAPTAQVYLAERSAAVADGRRWLHEARFLLRHESGDGLTVILPAAARVASASVDGKELTPMQPDPLRVWLPLGERSGVIRVRLCWFFHDGVETLERPNLAPAKVEHAAAGPTVGMLSLPAGWKLDPEKADSPQPGAVQAAAQELTRADAQLRLSRALAEQGPGLALAAAQRRFYLHCRRAEQALKVADGGGATGPGGVGLARWLQQLQDEDRDLARKGRFEGLRDEADRAARAGTAMPPAEGAESASRLLGPGDGRAAVCVTLPDRGTPLYWRGDGAAAPPQVHLAPAEEGGATWPWLAALAVVWLLSLPGFVRTAARLFKWELLGALGALGWWAVGPTPVVVGLLAAWLVGRALSLARALGRLAWRRPITE